MLQLISPKEMRQCEARYFESANVPSIEVMERAAEALAETTRVHFPDAHTVFIACGPGGNGGDGYACARLLAKAGLHCAVYASAPAQSADAIVNADRARADGIEIFLSRLPDERPDLWIDCLYGTGLSRAPEGTSAELIRRINYDRSNGTKTIAADIPSGLNGENGKAYDPCVEADLTVTFQFNKYGHFLQDGLDVCGKIIVADVGFPMEFFASAQLSLIQPDDLRMASFQRKRNIHKGSCGHLLIVAGSVGMAGAAVLCAKAALRSGAGLVTIACPESLLPILQIHVPCAMCLPLAEENGAISIRALPKLNRAIIGKSAVAIGPGLSRKAAPEILHAILECNLRAVIDADALNLLAENPPLQSLLRPHHVLTPHPGEAARLLGRPCVDPISDAIALSELGATIVLKGASRVICGSGVSFISASGGCGMARGGSGDVFTGLLGGTLAAPMANADLDTAIAATVARVCEIHGLAGELAQTAYGRRSMNAADLIEFLPEVFKRYVD